jgi:hypothetical protein
VRAIARPAPHAQQHQKHMHTHTHSPILALPGLPSETLNVKTIEGFDTLAGPGFFATDSTQMQSWPGSNPEDSSMSPRPSAMRPSTQNQQPTPFGTIQTSGTVPTKAGGSDATIQNTGSERSAANQYGFDQDLRLYSVLGPFMAPARIKDVWHSGKIQSAYTSNFPGVLTIHAKVSDEPMVSTRVQEIMHNNALYHTAPVIGTSYLMAGDRTTQYHTYAETDSILSFCNPLQSDLNNAPGAVLNNDISDDPVSSANSRFGASPGPIWSSRTGQQSSNGNEATAPSQWTVPRRHHICRKQVCMHVHIDFLYIVYR